ncbi:MAG: hypothetical protein KDE32_09315 [Novosphingobium sp.]|nr:hypothetical protein [Novosphingobium sp.]
MTSYRPALRNVAVSGLIAVALSACASTGGTTGGKSPKSITRAPVRTPVATPLRDPQFRMEPGLEGVIGATQAQVIGQFGKPRLEVWEGDARKLQFTGTACVLDIYLYPTSRSHDPLATYVEARRSDGRDVDKAACVQALRGSRGQ